MIAAFVDVDDGGYDSDPWQPGENMEMETTTTRSQNFWSADNEFISDSARIRD